MTMTSASGFVQLEDSLNQPHIHGSLLEELYTDTIFSEIATTDYFSDLRCGTTVIIQREPDINIHRYQKNQRLKIDPIQGICEHELSIDHAYYANVKFDDLDKEFICRENDLREAFRHRVIRKMKETVEAVAFSTIFADAAVANQGDSAGAQSGMYDLGKLGTPYDMNPDTIMNFLFYADAVLMEQSAPMDGNRFMIFPNVAKPIFVQSPYMNKDLLGDCVDCLPARTGRMYNDIYGFNIYFSDRLPSCTDPVTNQTAYPILFGHSDAMAYTMHMGNFEVIRLEGTFGEALRVLMTFGVGTVREELLGAGYATFSLTSN